MVTILAVSCVVYLWQIKLTKSAISPVYDQINEYVKTLKPSSTKIVFPDDQVQNILLAVNSERDKNKLAKLSWSDDLAKAAKSRAAVINSLGDFTGTISGLTREKAYDLVAYETSYFGDLNLHLSDPGEDFMTEILKNSQKKEMVLLDKFTEVGIAETESNGYHIYYLLFGNRRPKTTQSVAPKTIVKQKITWGGPELWEAVNKRRVEFGVNKLNKKDELCTIASIRLNQLLELNKLDGHAGFKPVLDRSDLKWISEKYNISEFLAQGYSTPEETVSGWENTLGHRGLLTGGEYVWGCVYAQNSFAVAISAY